AKLSIGSSTYSGTIVSLAAMDIFSLLKLVVALRDLMEATLMVGLFSIGEPSGLRPMSARRPNLRDMAVFMAFVDWRKASASAAIEVEERILMRRGRPRLKKMKGGSNGRKGEFRRISSRQVSSTANTFSPHQCTQTQLLEDITHETQRDSAVDQHI